MRSADFKPWWEKVNAFQNFEERQEFLRGLQGYRPANSQDIMLGMISSGYVRNKFEKPNPHTGEKKQ